MNKLVSKNSVQRFKQGRKIQKALLGTVISNLLLPLTYKGAKKTANFVGQSIDEMKKGPGRQQNGKTIPIKNNKKFVKREYIDPNGNLFKWNEDENGNYISGRTVDSIGNVYWRGSDGSMTLIKKGNINKPEGKKPVVANKVLSKYSGVDLQGKTVGEWQNILKKYYAPGTYKNDGIWGDNTEEAYRRYLTIANTDFTPVSKEPIEIPNNEDNNVNFDYEKFKRAALASDYTPDSIEQKLVTTPITYNRSMTRDWLRNNIGTAYGISGAMRAATRRKLNGQATDDDIMLIKSNQKLYDALKNAGLFKKGGQLPSRNVVERFKNGGIQKFQNAGNLPTAPKAKDRYKDSYKSWDWPQYKEVTAGSRLFPGARISQTIEGSDTTYMETPPRFPFVKVVPRVAKNNAKTIEWRDLITGQTYPEVKRGNSREYETLKRRFNTAWNLAK